MNNKLKVTTPTDREIVMTRVFDAPRELVWDANTKPELIKHWLTGPPGWTMTVCEADLRVGGTFRWAWRGPDGIEMTMTGVHREVVPRQRIVRTERFETGCTPGAGEQIASVVLTDQGERTLLTLTVGFPSKESRDAMVQAGMEGGVSAGYDRLEEMLTATSTR
jgi:uncharacterized protein YndB with AHSA1/START domain